MSGPSQNGSRKRRILIGSIICILLAGAAAAVGAGLWLYKKDDGKEKKKQSPAPGTQNSTKTLSASAAEVDWEKEKSDAQLITLDQVDQFISRSKTVAKSRGIDIGDKDIFVSAESALMYIRDMQLTDVQDVLRDFANGVKLTDIRIAKLDSALESVKKMLSKNGINEWGQMLAKRHNMAKLASKTGTANTTSLNDLLEMAKDMGYDLLSEPDETGDSMSADESLDDDAGSNTTDSKGNSSGKGQGNNTRGTVPDSSRDGGARDSKDTGDQSGDDTGDEEQPTMPSRGDNGDMGKGNGSGSGGTTGTNRDGTSTMPSTGSSSKDTEDANNVKPQLPIRGGGSRAAFDPESSEDTEPVYPHHGRKLHKNRKALAAKTFGSACIPVIFHVYQYQNGSGPVLPEAGQFKKAIKYLVKRTNKIFTNPEYSLTDGRSNRLNRIKTTIKFKLAEIRDDSSKFSYLKLSYDDWINCGNPAYSSDKLTGIQNANKLDPTKYIHVSVCGWNLNAPSGYATTPGLEATALGWSEGNSTSHHLLLLQATMVSSYAFNRKEQFDYGAQVFAHELGHYLGLEHPQADNCDTDEDGLDDTPVSLVAQEQYWYWDLLSTCDKWRKEKTKLDLPKLAVEYNSCPSKPGGDPIFNIMSYTPSACVSHFTAEQVLRLHAMILKYRPMLYKNSKNSKC